MIKPIHTEQDNIAAITEIERLWNAEPDSPDEERLEVLAVLVSDFEDRHYMQDTGDYERHCRRNIITIMQAFVLLQLLFAAEGWFSNTLILFIGALFHAACFWRLVYLTRR